MLQSLRGIEKKVSYLSIVEKKELSVLSDLYNQLIADKFDLTYELEQLKAYCNKKVSDKEAELLRVSNEVNRIDSLRNEIVNSNFNIKPIRMKVVKVKPIKVESTEKRKVSFYAKRK